MKSLSTPKFTTLIAMIAGALLAAGCGTAQQGLGNYVWLDADRDGVQDSPEIGVKGVRVQVHDSLGQVVEETATNPDGVYAFENLPSGDYKLKFLLPEGYSFTTRDQRNDDTLDSDVDPVTGETLVFQYEAGSDDFTWDAGLTESSSIPTETPPPPPTIEPQSTATPDRAQEAYMNPGLAGSTMVGFSEFADIDMINLSGRFMGMSLADDDPLPNSLPYYLVDPVGRLYFGYLGDTQGLSANISIFRPGDSSFQPSLFRNVDTGTGPAPVRPSFEEGNVTDSESAGYCATGNALLADLNINVADLEPIGPHSLWVYKQKPSGDGFDLVHVSLTVDQARAVLETLLDAAAGGEPPDPRPFIYGRVYRAVGEEIVTVTREEAAASVLAQLYPDLTSITQFGMLEFFECAQLLLSR